MKKEILISLVSMIFGLTVYFVFHIGLVHRNNVFFVIIRNYIPDMCWTLSFFFVSISFAKKISKKPLLLNCIYVLSIAIIFEFLQKMDMISGTFDILDILVYVISILSAYFIEKKLRREKYEKSI